MIFSRFKWNEKTILELGSPIKAYIHYRQSRFNLLTGFPEAQNFEDLLSTLESVSLEQKMKHPKVFHFYYELGLVLAGQGHSVDDTTPLVVEIEYAEKKFKSPSPGPLKKLALQSIERPTWSEYKEAFNRVQEKLLDGSCYQVNLTYPYDFMVDEILDPRDLADFFFSRKGLGAYAHCTYLGEEMILSNSPECLFQYQNKRITAMPIKGTMKREGNWRNQWQEMLDDKKQEGELLMITDLLKNDLNKLDRPKAKVKKLRAPLLVPGLLHQYSLLSLKLHEDISLLSTLKSLFPGGSITGAPKKSVMQIIQEVERFQRGIYCGTTLLCMGEKKTASINIRTASISLGERLWRYGAGGGVTLLSKPVEEFQEMEAKVASFLTLLKSPGYTAKKK